MKQTKAAAARGRTKGRSKASRTAAKRRAVRAAASDGVLPKGMRWLAEPGFVWQVFDHKRFCVGAWAKEAPARAAYAELRKGAEIVTCKDYGGWPSPFMAYMKREAIAREVKA